jgi:hypothetical protein
MLIQIANLIGLPPHKLGAKISSSYNSLESENASFLSDCLAPHLQLWIEEIECKLLTESEKERNTRWVEADTSKLVPLDATTQNKIRIDKLNNGLASWEELRTELTLTTTKDPDQKWRHAANIVVEGTAVTELEVDQPTVTTPAKEELPPLPEPDTEAQDDVARKLSEQILGRLITRMKTAVLNGNTELEPHRTVVLDHLGALPNGEQYGDDLLIRLQSEIDATVNAKHEALFSRIDVAEEVKQLWQK